jgi:hypothetical protein
MFFMMRLLLLFGAIAAGIAMYGPRGLVWTASVPAQVQVTAAEQETADCLERYRKGQRMTKAGC